MKERGTVTAASPGRVDIAIEPSNACASCGACGESDGGKRLLTGVVDSLGALPGDTVEVDTPARARRRAQLIVYILPVVMLIVGYLAGFLLSSSMGAEPDTAGAVVGLLAGAATVAGMRFVGRGAADQQTFEPQVHAIISRGTERRSSAR